MADFICIVCPRGCRLHVDENDGYRVTGQFCPRGEVYGKQESQHPTRMLCSTVKLEGGPERRLPVRTASPIPKEKVAAAMRQIRLCRQKAPVRLGDVVIPDIAGSGVDLIATRSFGKI